MTKKITILNLSTLAAALSAGASSVDLDVNAPDESGGNSGGGYVPSVGFGPAPGGVVPGSSDKFFAIRIPSDCEPTFDRGEAVETLPDGSPNPQGVYTYEFPDALGSVSTVKITLNSGGGVEGIEATRTPGQ